LKIENCLPMVSLREMSRRDRDPLKGEKLKIKNFTYMLAVIKTGGKQYLVKPGDKIKIEKIEREENKEIIFDQVLLVDLPAGRQGKNKKIEIGAPLVNEAKVVGKILRQGKAKKVIVFKYKPKTRYKKKAGHRQLFTEVEITKIETESK